jgi:hypothetical protein
MVTKKKTFNNYKYSTVAFLNTAKTSVPSKSPGYIHMIPSTWPTKRCPNYKYFQDDTSMINMVITIIHMFLTVDICLVDTLW